MIYTVTVSPALDYGMNVHSLKTGEINRSTEQTLKPGGKGINVALMLKNLGVDSVVLGFIGGKIGALVNQLLIDSGLKSDLIEIAGETRINVKISGETETAINGCGPIPTAKNLNELRTKMSRMTSSDILVLSGAVPVSIGSDIYLNLISSLQDPKPLIVIDTSGSTLIESLKVRPYLIKPNLGELEEVTRIKVSNESSLKQSLDSLRVYGARNILVSLGSAGAVLSQEDGQMFYVQAPCGHPRSTVGAGDSLVAGFLAGLTGGRSFFESLKMGVAAGSATAFSGTLASWIEIKSLLDKM